MIKPGRCLNLTRIWLLSFAALVLAACQQAALSPTVEPAQADPTVLPTASPTPKPVPTNTPTPTLTARPALLEQPTTVPSPTPTARPERNEIAFSPWDHVLALAWSPDGSLLAAAAGSRVHVFRFPGLEEVMTLPVGVRPSQLAFDPTRPPESPLLAMAVRDGSLQFWDPLSGQRLAVWDAHRKSANSLAFNPDGASLASVGNDAMVRLWDLNRFHTTGEPVFALQAEMIGGAVAVPAVRYSPDGALLASVDLGVIRLRDPQTQRLARTLRTETALYDIAFSPDGRWLAAGELDDRVQFWNPASGEQTAVWSMPAKSSGSGRPFIWALTFNPNGSFLAAGSSTGRLAVWQMDDQSLILDEFAHTRGTAALAFSPLGDVLATGGLDGMLRIWRLK